MDARRGIRVRPAGIRDVAGVAQLERQVFTVPWTAPSFESLIGAQRSLFLVAVGEEPASGAGPGAPSTLLGYGVLWWASDLGELANLAVAPEARGRGIATRLLDRLLAEARAAGLASVFLEVRASNEAAASLYEKRGFREVGLRRDYYSRPREDARILRLEL
jgi:[ribosomal protein S18]-alanine N-acetyltransferase